MTRLQPQLGNEDDVRPPKRAKFSSTASARIDDSALEEGSIVRRHPLGVRPAGNALTSSADCKQSAGSFAILLDELLMQFLESLQVPHLLKLGATCKALHAFTRSEELWRTLFTE